MSRRSNMAKVRRARRKRVRRPVVRYLRTLYRMEATIERMHRARRAEQWARAAGWFLFGDLPAALAFGYQAAIAREAGHAEYAKALAMAGANAMGRLAYDAAKKGVEAQSETPEETRGRMP